MATLRSTPTWRLQQHRRPLEWTTIADTANATAGHAKVSITFVLVTLGLDALGVGLIAPIVPGLVQLLSHLPPERAAPWVGALIAAYAGMQFFAAPLLGALSDRFGRRPVILISVAGIGADYILLALAPSLWWLFLGRLIAGGPPRLTWRPPPPSSPT